MWVVPSSLTRLHSPLAFVYFSELLFYVISRDFNSNQGGSAILGLLHVS